MNVKLICGLLIICLTTLVALTAEAAPPFAKSTNRSIASGANADRCDYSDFGSSCVALYASEYYDIKGNYEDTWVGVFEDSNEYDPDTGVFTYSFRELGCSLPLGAISAGSNRVAVEASLDPSSPNCFTYGEIYIYDPSTPEPQWFPYAFDEVVDVHGVWEDPLESSTGPISRRMQTYDYWTETVIKWNYQCKESYGDLMRKGGFSVNGAFVPFEGLGSPGWSSFYITKCNDQNNPYR